MDGVGVRMRFFQFTKFHNSSPTVASVTVMEHRFGAERLYTEESILLFSPTWIAAIPSDSDSQRTAPNPAADIRAASSGSAGKCATDRGRYLYAV
jgi:hypothetical protein